MATASPVIVRLNAETYPVIPEEHQMLAPLQATWRELEGEHDEEILAAVSGCDAVMVVSSTINSRIIAAMPTCRVIARMGAGVDKIAIDAATRAGIYVTNLPDFCTDEVADHTMAMLLAIARKLTWYDAQMREGRRPMDVHGLHRLSRQWLGIIGFGRIGRAVARRAQAFGLRVCIFDPQVMPEQAQATGVQPATLETLLAESDYVALCCALTPETEQMLSRREFQRMKPGAVLINTGRGALINEADLCLALQEGKVAAAALDVFAGINVFPPEGFATQSLLFALPNLLMSPHVAAFSEESMFEQKVGGAQAVVAALTGQRPAHVVNPEVIPWFTDAVVHQKEGLAWK
jgi:D-3-phosphoglycerate dehydrogenase